MRRKYKKDKLPAFVPLEIRMLLQSEAWKKLSGSAAKVYIFLRSKAFGPLQRAMQVEIKIPYSIIEADTGLSRQTVRNAIVELENKGFIDLIEQGGLKSGGLQHEHLHSGNPLL